MRRLWSQLILLILFLAFLSACSGQNTLPQRFSSVDPAARLTTFVDAPDGWVAQTTPQTITLASSAATLAKMQSANVGFDADEGAIVINRLNPAEVAGFNTPFEVYQALRSGSTIAGATIVAEVQGNFGGKPAVKAQIQSAAGSGFVYVIRVGASYFLVLTVAATASTIQLTGDAVVSSLATQPGDTAAFSLSIAETATTYTQDPAFVIATDLDSAPALRFVSLGTGGSVALRLAEGSPLSTGDYPLSVDGLPIVTIPVADGRVLACSGLIEGTLSIARAEAGFFSGSFALTVTDCALREFPSQTVINAAPPYETLTVSGTFSDVPLPTSLSSE